MSVPELFGIIKLSFRQAEGRRVNVAVLCLKYIASVCVAGAMTGLFLLSERTGVRAALMAACAAGLLLAVSMRGVLLREMYLLSERYLRSGEENRIPRPALTALVSGELVYLAVIRTVTVVMLSPAYVCLRYGLTYYSLSADRLGFVLLLSAAALLAAGGLLFDAAIGARLSCAEYLRLSGQCRDMLSALDTSWELSRGGCGDLLRLRFISLPCAPGLSHLCLINYSQRLIRRKGLPSSDGLRVEIVCDAYGEQHLELI